MGLFGKQCQSCGMPLAKDELGGGTEADGSKSTVYCSYCYQQGQFLEPQLTVEQMMAKVEAKMREMKFPKFIAKLFTRQLPKLKRWAKALPPTH